MTADPNRPCTKCGASPPEAAFYLEHGIRTSQCRECMKAKSRAWHASNRERANSRSRAYRSANARRLREYDKLRYYANHEQALAYRKAYYQAHRAEWANWTRAWRAAHPDKVRGSHRAYRQRHAAAIAARRHSYYCSHKTQYRDQDALHRARVHGVSVAEDVRRAHVFERDGGRCRYCSAVVTLDTMHLDHVIPHAAGGAHSYDNVVVACASCNLRKSSRTPEQAGVALMAPPSPF